MSTKTFVIAYLFLVARLAAAPAFDHPLTLSELVDLALANNPSTKQAWWNANRATSVVGIAQSAYYPHLALEANVKNGRDFKFINGPDTTYTIVGADLILTLMLYDFGERSADVKAAKMALLAAQWHTDWNIQKVMVKVLENAYSTLHTQEVLAASKNSIEDAEKVLEAARGLNRAGLTAISDVYTSQSNLSVMKMELTQQKALLAIEKGKLSSSIGLQADAAFEVAPLNSIYAPEKLQIDALIALAMQQRADLIAKQARLSEAYAYKDKACAAYGPKVAFYGRGGANHAIHDKANAAQYQLTLNLSIPLFNGFETLYNNRKAYANTQLAQEELADLQLAIALEVLTYSSSLEAAQEMLPEAEENLNSALKAYESVLDKYKAGKERIAEVSIAQRQLAAARIRYSDVKTRWLVSLANLAYATGTLGIP